MEISHQFSCCMVLNVLFILCNSTWPCSCRNSTLFCREEERLALLEFKRSLRYEPSGLLQSWEMEDCCRWKGVACDPKTGHVTKLELRPSLFPSRFLDSYKQFSSYELSPSISKLRYLTHLDLSSFEITNNTAIPKFIGSMKQLQYLSLSDVGFTGIIPCYFKNLTHLEVLDLQESGYSYSYSYDPMLLIDPQWISGLRSLKYLDMSGLQLGKAHDLIKVLGELPSLTHLVLSHSGINNSHLSHAGRLQNHSSFPNLQYLDLSANNFHGQIPGIVLQNIPSLIYLNLSYNYFDSFESPFPLSPNLRNLDISVNQFQGQTPGALQNMTSLTYLHLSRNHFTSIPMWFTCLKSLLHLDLGSNSLNHIEGGFLTLLKGKCNLRSLKVNDNRLHGEMSDGNSTVFCAFSLEEVDASGNRNLEGNLPDWLWNLTNLRYLSLSDNRLQGVISESLGQLLSLQWLDLAWNLLNGPIPQSLGQLSDLQQLDLSGNSLGGVVSEVHLSNLFKLKALILSDNNLLIRIKDDWVPPFQIVEIGMRSCKFEAQFPIWIQSQRRFNTIDLSNASISGDMPTWLVTEVELRILNLSYNQITGPIQKFPSSLEVLDLSHNLISGPIMPKMGIEVPLLSTLFLNNNLLTGSVPTSFCAFEGLSQIDLSNNKLSGSIPDCWNSEGINFINWSSNDIFGHVPGSIGNLTYLISLDLNNNSLQGELPRTFKNLGNLEVLDLGENNFSGDLSSWIGNNFQGLQILRMQHNRFSGGIPLQLCSLSMLHILDLSGNNLVGMLPEELTDLIGLRDLNLSHNHLSGNIPGKIGHMLWVESLDVSNNNLSGTIPQGTSMLTFLSHLNLSNNNFSGRIPKGNRLDTLYQVDHSIYAGNPLLCGDPLQKKCPGDKEVEGDKSNSLDKIIFYAATFLGFTAGFWGVIGTLVLRNDWRANYFRFAEETIDKVYVAATVEVAKMKKRMNG